MQKILFAATVLLSLTRSEETTRETENPFCPDGHPQMVANVLQAELHTCGWALNKNPDLKKWVNEELPKYDPSQAWKAETHGRGAKFHLHKVTTMACFASHHLDENQNVKPEYENLESSGIRQQNHTETEQVDVAKMTGDEVTKLLLDHGVAPSRQHDELWAYLYYGFEWNNLLWKTLYILMNVC